MVIPGSLAEFGVDGKASCGCKSLGLSWFLGVPGYSLGLLRGKLERLLPAAVD